MNRSTSTLAALGLVLVGFAAGCDPEETTDAIASTPNQPTAQPTEERLVLRAEERMAHVCEGDWIEAYDFVSPEIKEYMTIYSFLENKDNHRYEQPTKPNVVAWDGDTAHLEVSVLWTPLHPILQQVDNLPEGQTLTERIEMVETWKFADGDWYMQWPPVRLSDFYQEHPDLLKKDKSE